MARPKKLLTEQDIAQLEAITRGDSVAAVGYRLAAVRAYVGHSAEEVGRFFKVRTETVIRWASKFHAHGIDGLSNKATGHRGMKLTGSNAETVRGWLSHDCDAKGNAVHWTLKRLSLEIKNNLGIDISVAALASTLKKMKTTLKRPRPMHDNSSPKQREEFKKKSANDHSEDQANP